MIQLILSDEKATLDCGVKFAQGCLPLAESMQSALIIYLIGDLGAGKTTFCRGFLQALGVKGAVKSPTYTLVESYQLKDVTVYHFDLYRLLDPEELEYMGIRDYFDKTAILLIEWPENAAAFLPKSDLSVTLQYVGYKRQLLIEAGSERGQSILASLTHG